MNRQLKLYIVRSLGSPVMDEGEFKKVLGLS